MDGFTIDWLCWAFIFAGQTLAYFLGFPCCKSFIALGVIATLVNYFAPRDVSVKSPKGWALVTGGSGGIGYSIACELAKEGYKIILAARNKQQLEQSSQEIKRKYQVECLFLSVDLSSPKGAQTLYDETKKITANVDVLVNNAGYGLIGQFAIHSLADSEQVIECNITSLVRLTRLYVGDMLARKYGKILLTGSVAGFQPGPDMAVYYASKAFVNTFGEGLSLELRGTGVTVSTLCPGPTASSFGERSGNDKSWLFTLVPIDSSARVAAAAVKGLNSGDRVIFPGINYVNALFGRFAPRSLMLVFARFLNATK